MNNNEVNKLDMESANIISGNIEKIGALFPNVIKEGKIDFETLKQELSNDLIDEKKEKYQMVWAGKKEAILESNLPTRETLRPKVNLSTNFDCAKNIYIKGDNLEVLKILQESYLNKVNVIYIDPPYNTGNDFIYKDDYTKSEQDELLESGQIDSYNNRLISNNTSNGKFHSDWLSMMYSRLKLSRNLLSKDGIIFISIDDNEFANLQKICNEIFGENNLIANLAVEMSKTQGMKVKAAQDGRIVKNHEYILVYAKDNFNDKKRLPLYDKAEPYDGHFDIVMDEEGNVQNLIDYLKNNNNVVKIFEKYQLSLDKKNISNVMQYDDWFKNYINNELSDKLYRASMIKSNEIQNLTIEENKVVKYGKYFLRKNSAGTIEQLQSFKDTLNVSDEYNSEFTRTTIRGALWKGFYSDMMNIGKEGDVEFKNGKKPVRLIEQLLKWSNVEDGIVLDFFSGSATTAHAVMLYNAKYNHKARYILVQIPQKIEDKKYDTICDLALQRIENSAAKVKSNYNIDEHIGVRVYETDSSNMKDIYYEPSKLNQTQLNMFESNIKEDRTSEDLLTQVILDLGLTLDLSIEERNILNNKVYFVEGNSLVACFDNQINIDILNQICEVKPLKVVFRESSFRNDSDKINAYERIKKLSPETEISVI